MYYTLTFSLKTTNKRNLRKCLTCYNGYGRVILACSFKCKHDLLIHLWNGKMRTKNLEDDNHYGMDSLNVSLQAYSLQSAKHLCWLYLNNQKASPIHLKEFLFLLWLLVLCTKCYSGCFFQKWTNKIQSLSLWNRGVCSKMVESTKWQETHRRCDNYLRYIWWEVAREWFP